MTLDPQKLPREYPRKYVPESLNAGDWAQLEPLLGELERRSLDTPEALERWLLDRSELAAVIQEEGAIRYIRMTCQTDNPDYEQAYLHFVEEIEPQLKPRFHRLDELYMRSPARSRLPQERYFVLDRKIQNSVELFREENVPLETEEEKAGQPYRKIMAAMTVHYDGKEQTLQQMARYLEEPQRQIRHEAWERIVERRLKDREKLDEIFDELLKIRQRIAENAGFANYREYAFRKRERFDYTPEDCERFHRAIERHIVPLMRDLQRWRREKLGVDELRPWDLQVDPEGKPPLRPFSKADELIEGCREIFERVDPELSAQFRCLAELDLLDLESRKGKAPGGYQATLEEHRLPFIFMNAVGRDSDVRTLLHEGGHAFHTFATRDEPLIAYRHAPLEFAEVASMGMELLSAPHLSVFYSPEEAERSRKRHLEGIVTLLSWIATIDAFQHWIYTHPGHTRKEREAKWLELHERFGGIESWEGYEEALRSDWQRQAHLYLHPFYYIEYGIAQLGALGIWLHSQRDYREAVQLYRRALALGGSRPLPKLFQAAGLPFDFGEEAVGRAATGLRYTLGL
jgi:oligoendopeptidase F